MFCSIPAEELGQQHQGLPKEQSQKSIWMLNYTHHGDERGMPSSDSLMNGVMLYEGPQQRTI
jgi:hypothetical protein